MITCLILMIYSKKDFTVFNGYALKRKAEEINMSFEQ